MKPNFYNLTLEQVVAHLTKIGHKPFRAEQLYKWIYDKQVMNPDLWLNLSKDFRSSVGNVFSFELPEMLTELISKDGTRKYLFDMGNGLSAETVLIPNNERNTLCVSSQVGCNMACKFCYTAKQKLKKRLTVSEIVGQFIGVQNSLPSDVKITNVVFMGMGEPLDNPENVFSAIQNLHNPLGINFSKRKITVSTSGLVDRIPLITDAGVRLAVSLNGSNDKIRTELMPINKKWPIEKLLKACLQHARDSKDKVTFEYILMKGLTDSLEDAHYLYQLTKNIPCKINIIPFNEHPQSGYKRSEEDDIQKFQNRLIRLGAHVLRRKTMGEDIYAACGQLNSLPKKDSLCN